MRTWNIRMKAGHIYTDGMKPIPAAESILKHSNVVGNIGVKRKVKKDFKEGTTT